MYAPAPLPGGDAPAGIDDGGVFSRESGEVLYFFYVREERAVHRFGSLDFVGPEGKGILFQYVDLDSVGIAPEIELV